MGVQVVDPLTTTLSALADPTRRAIVARLARGEASVTELCEPFHLSQPAISRHLKVLEKAGVISRGRSAQFRPCRLEAARLKGLADWLDELRRLCGERFERPEARLADAADNNEEAKRRGRT
jgi:DNA-binding transcriptional ArsR family regulator